MDSLMKKTNLKKLIKRRQKRFNQIVKTLNGTISQDELWMGRFVVRQLDRTVFPYSDGSGASIKYKIGIYDKKTKSYAFGFIEDFNAPMFSTLALNRAVDKFIVEILDVWSNETPKKDIFDYNKIKFVADDYELICDCSIFR
jgi:hypothetical protein